MNPSARLLTTITITGLHNPCRIKFIKTKEKRYGKEEEGHEEEIEGDVRTI